MELPVRKSSDAPRRGYSDDEVTDMYELSRLWLESGQHRRAEAILLGLNEVAPHFAPAWLGTSFLKAEAGNYDSALGAAKQALRAEPESVEAMLYIATLSLTLGDSSTAGTYLGEVGERIEQGKTSNPSVNRFFKMQLARYQGRE